MVALCSAQQRPIILGHAHEFCPPLFDVSVQQRIRVHKSLALGFGRLEPLHVSLVVMATQIGARGIAKDVHKETDEVVGFIDFQKTSSSGCVNPQANRFQRFFDPAELSRALRRDT